MKPHKNHFKKDQVLWKLFSKVVRKYYSVPAGGSNQRTIPNHQLVFVCSFTCCLVHWSWTSRLWFHQIGSLCKVEQIKTFFFVSSVFFFFFDARPEAIKIEVGKLMLVSINTRLPRLVLIILISSKPKLIWSDVCQKDTSTFKKKSSNYI